MIIYSDGFFFSCGFHSQSILDQKPQYYDEHAAVADELDKVLKETANIGHRQLEGELEQLLDQLKEILSDVANSYETILTSLSKLKVVDDFMGSFNKWMLLTENKLKEKALRSDVDAKKILLEKFKVLTIIPFNFFKRLSIV